jgi:molybdopterin-binding protein
MPRFFRTRLAAAGTPGPQMRLPSVYADVDAAMNEFSVREAAVLLGVSDDTVRRWADNGRVRIGKSASGRQVIAGTDLVPLITELAAESPLAGTFPGARASARNRFTGIVTAVKRDGVMAQVELQAGPFRVVSLMSREAADELGLEPGVLASASAKATVVTIEVPEGRS